MREDTALEKMVYSRRPKFESVAQFSAFCRIVGDMWKNAGPPSISGAMIDQARLGVRVDTSTAPASSYEPKSPYHLAWIRLIIVRASERISGERKMLVWSEHDLRGRSQKAIAEYERIATSTISDWIAEVRDALAFLLADMGLMDRAHLERGEA